MNFSEIIIDKIMKKIKSTGEKKKLVLPESSDIRTLEALSILSGKEWLSGVYTIGNRDLILKTAKEKNINLSGVEIIDIEKSGEFYKYVDMYYELRKHKGVQKDEAAETMKNSLFYGAMMLKENAVHGMVAGSINTTADVLKAAIQIVKTMPGIKRVSSSFVMIVPNSKLGFNGNFLFADCAVIPDPDAEALADIAGASARTFELIFDAKPIVAFLSFSTLCSAQHPLVEKVQAAARIAKHRFPEYEMDGEFQLDAAIVPSVANRKAPNNSVAGKANVLIFPDLNSGNIGYKLVQRLAGAEAYGPIIQGLAKPVSDLSRGCSADDIVNVAAITTLESYLYKS